MKHMMIAATPGADSSGLCQRCNNSIPAYAHRNRRYCLKCFLDHCRDVTRHYVWCHRQGITDSQLDEREAILGELMRARTDSHEKVQFGLWELGLLVAFGYEDSVRERLKLIKATTTDLKDRQVKGWEPENPNVQYLDLQLQDIEGDTGTFGASGRSAHHARQIIRHVGNKFRESGHSIIHDLSTRWKLSNCERAMDNPDRSLDILNDTSDFLHELRRKQARKNIEVGLQREQEEAILTLARFFNELRQLGLIAGHLHQPEQAERIFSSLHALALEAEGLTPWAAVDWLREQGEFQHCLRLYDKHSHLRLPDEQATDFFAQARSKLEKLPRSVIHFQMLARGEVPFLYDTGRIEESQIRFIEYAQLCYLEHPDKHSLRRLGEFAEHYYFDIPAELQEHPVRTFTSFQLPFSQPAFIDILFPQQRIHYFPNNDAALQIF